ncbi:MAG: hypothetical protein RSG92_04010 [Pseudomonas sp.]
MFTISACNSPISVPAYLHEQHVPVPMHNIDEAILACHFEAILALLDGAENPFPERLQLRNGWLSPDM